MSSKPVVQRERALVRKFPYPIFYVEQATEVDVWRVLHGARDVPAWLQAPLDD